jgi:serine O-acetyltransferase
MRADVDAVHDADPAAKSRLEVLLCYPGLHAVWAHALTHAVWTAGYTLTARVLSQLVRFLTGVEIHPAATVGDRVVVDHGMGVVVGETAEIGDRVHMFHGVTLGGNSPDPVKRHPTVEDDVTIGANATILGDVVVGENANVGAGAVVTDDVPPGATVVGIPAERVDDPDTTDEDVDDPDATNEDVVSDPDAIDEGVVDPDGTDEDVASDPDCLDESVVDAASEVDATDGVACTDGVTAGCETGRVDEAVPSDDDDVASADD